MIDYPLIHSARIIWIYIMGFIDDNNIKATLTDFAIVTDAVTHGLWTAKYNSWLEFFGIDGSSVDAAVATLAFIRIAILLDKGTIKR